MILGIRPARPEEPYTMMVLYTLYHILYYISHSRMNRVSFSQRILYITRTVIKGYKKGGKESISIYTLVTRILGQYQY